MNQYDDDIPNEPPSSTAKSFSGLRGRLGAAWAARGNTPRRLSDHTASETNGDIRHDDAVDAPRTEPRRRTDHAARAPVADPVVAALARSGAPGYSSGRRTNETSTPGSSSDWSGPPPEPRFTGRYAGYDLDDPDAEAARRQRQNLALVAMLGALLLVGLTALIAGNRTPAATAVDVPPASTAVTAAVEVTSVTTPTPAVTTVTATLTSTLGANTTTATHVATTTITRTTQAGGGTACPVAPRHVQVRVWNATAINNLAANTANALRSKGFAVNPEVASAPSGTTVALAAVIRSGVGGQDSARTVGRFVGGEVSYLTDNRAGSDVDLILGPRFTLGAGC